MKAIIKNNVRPKILAANIKAENAEKIQAIAEKHNAEYLIADDLQKSVANLLGEKTSENSDLGKYPDSENECLLFAGFERVSLNKLLDDFKSMSIRIPLKAMYTPYNRDWSFAHLINELTEEFRNMTGGDLK